jgi:hypothetical protein
MALGQVRGKAEPQLRKFKSDVAVEPRRGDLPERGKILSASRAGVFGTSAVLSKIVESGLELKSV